ncbi:hypothetical protein AB0G20_39465 [Streptomyces sp. NPDC024017]|uniref:carbohydrate ABC transporter permease n=1 Tax=Streptomyces sp. NPDC024017 TaxID=3154326 RepID=UPI0033CA68D9
MARQLLKRKNLDRIGLFFVALVMISPVILFFIWMISLSLKYEIDNGAYPPILIPERFAWSNYVKVFEENNFFLYFWNSVLVTGAATILALVIGVPAGYGIARLKAEKSAVVIMIARMTPGLSFLIPLFLLFQWLNLLGAGTTSLRDVQANTRAARGCCAPAERERLRDAARPAHPGCCATGMTLRPLRSRSPRGSAPVGFFRCASEPLGPAGAGQAGCVSGVPSCAAG